MKAKEALKDQSFWSLLIINVAILVYYLQYNTGFKTLVWIYWAQSVLIGFFTFLQLVTIKNMVPGSMTMNDKPLTDDGKGRGCMAGFFAVHYGFFHLGYFIFIFTITDLKEAFDWRLFQFSVGAFALDQLWNFIRYKQWEKTHHPSGGVIFFLPYARIIPMHLTILLPKFFGFIPQMGLFLVLKMFADLLMHVVSLMVYGKAEPEDPTVLRTVK